MKKIDVANFLNRLKEPLTVINGCKKYHEMNERDMEYVISRDIVALKPNDKNHMFAGIKTIIASWNAIRLRWIPTSKRNNLENDITSSLDVCYSDLNKLEGKNLLELNYADFKIIKQIFSIFSSKQSIEYTGGSKALHIIKPDIFMMWDASIRDAYHKFHSDKTHPKEECYIHFLQQSQGILKEVLSKTTAEKLWKQHSNFIDKSFVEAFSFRESPLKMLDECNFMKFKQNQDF
ncbi:MAG: hypothetical protein WED07_12280 [Candidatus Freyarchaeum deiterrae]